MTQQWGIGTTYPVTRYRDSSASSSCLEREDLRTPDPWNDVDASTEDQHVHEEERDRSRRSRLLADRQQDRDHQHADRKDAAASHHGLTATHPVKRQSWECVTDGKHELDKPCDELGAAGAHSDVLDKHGGHVVDDL